MSENDEEVLIAMLNSDNVEDINLALGIVNNMESNRNLLIKLKPDDILDITNELTESKWYKSLLIAGGACYYRKDLKGDIPLRFKRGNE